MRPLATSARLPPARPTPIRPRPAPPLSRMPRRVRVRRRHTGFKLSCCCWNHGQSPPLPPFYHGDHRRPPCCSCKLLGPKRCRVPPLSGVSSQVMRALPGSPLFPARLPSGSLSTAAGFVSRRIAPHRLALLRTALHRAISCGTSIASNRIACIASRRIT